MKQMNAPKQSKFQQTTSQLQTFKSGCLFFSHQIKMNPFQKNN